MTASGLTVGQSTGTGVATGLLHLDQALVALDDSITLGSGSTLEIDIGGVLRGTEFGAIDTALAFLDGILVANFTETPAIGIYDLIVSGSADGISGDFASVIVTGIDLSLLSYGIELDTVMGNVVEVYRFHVIPEPGTALLVALGLLACAAMRDRPARTLR